MSDAQQEQQPVAPVIDQEQLDKLGLSLFSKFKRYQADRKPLEDQWLKNLRQFRGIYDPEIEGVLDKNRSKAYPKVTRQKVIGTVSRLMEMLFPQTEKNWGIAPTPIPDIDQNDLLALLNQAINVVRGQAQQAQQAGQPMQPMQGLDPVEIEKQVVKFAQARCDAMEVVMNDQLTELDWVTLARKIIFSGVLYGAGILKGPLVKQKMQTTWKLDQNGQPQVQSSMQPFPYYEFMSCWSYYPDLTAKVRKQQDDYFERHVMSRQQVSDLGKRADFMADRVTKFLADNQEGNFKELWWETLLRQNGDKSNPSNVSGRKYEGAEFWGYISGHDLAAAGINIAPEKRGQLFCASAFLLGNVIVKCVVNPYKSQRRPDHVFVYEDDDINLMGSGLPPVVRDSQLAICEAARMTLDNASVVCGPILEANVELLMPGQNMALHAYKVFYREDEDRAGVPAVRDINIQSHISELQGIIELFRGFADSETALPPSSMGDMSQGGSEAMRTQGNMSMLMGAAALPIRDTVRNFDIFTESFISSLYEWNMQFNPRPDIKGDFQVAARGSTSLIAKEVRAAALDNFKMSLTPDELPYIKTGELLKERAKSRDIPDDVFEDDDVVKKKLAAQAQAQDQQTQTEQMMVAAQVKKIFSEVVRNLAAAQHTNVMAQTDPYQVLMEAITNATDSASRAKVADRAPAGA